MAGRRRRGAAESSWLRNHWAPTIAAVLLSIPAGVIVVMLTREPKSQPAKNELADELATNLSIPDPAGNQTAIRDPNPAPTNSVGATIPAAPGPAPQTAPPPAEKAEPQPPRVAAVTQAEPRAPARPAEPALSSRNCPARQVTLRFRIPGNTSSAFDALSGAETVRLHNCSDGGAEFETHYVRAAGPQPGLGGSWSKERMTFEFGYFSGSAVWGDVRCSVDAQAASERLYRGTITCAETGRKGHVMSPSAVEVSY